jgi:hypothetical protein
MPAAAERVGVRRRVRELLRRVHGERLRDPVHDHDDVDHRLDVHHDDDAAGDPV